MDQRLSELKADKFGIENNPFYNGLRFDDLKEYIKSAQSLKYLGVADSSKLPREKREIIEKMNLEELKLFFESEH